MSTCPSIYDDMRERTNLPMHKHMHTNTRMHLQGDDVDVKVVRMRDGERYPCAFGIGRKRVRGRQGLRMRSKVESSERFITSTSAMINFQFMLRKRLCCTSSTYS